MTNLTPDEADRMIRASVEVAGLTTDSLMDVWRAIVFGILERLDLGAYRPAVIGIAGDIVDLWGAVQPAMTHPPDGKFVYKPSEVHVLSDTFDELGRVAEIVRFGYQNLPPRSQAEHERAMELLKEIREHAKGGVEILRAMQAQNRKHSDIFITARELCMVGDRCQTLLEVTLGPVHVTAFKEAYDACIPGWFHAARMMQANDSTLN